MKHRADGDGSVYPEHVHGCTPPCGRPASDCPAGRVRWRGEVQLPPGPDGRRRKRRVSGTSRADVTRKVRALVRAREDGTLTADPGMTVAQWLDWWMPHVHRPKIRSSTAATYESIIETWLKPHLGRYRLTDVQVHHIDELTSAMRRAGTHRGRDGRAAGTIRQTLTVLHVAFRDAHRRGKVPRNILDLVDRPSVTNRAAPGWYSLEQARAILAAAEGDRLAARWDVALAIGARQGEALALAWTIRWLDTGETWHAVDLDTAVLRIEWAIRRRPGVHGCGPADPDTGAFPCGLVRAGCCPDRTDGGLVLERPKSQTSRRVIGLDPVLTSRFRDRRALWMRERVEEGARWRSWQTVAYVDEHTRRACEVDLVFGQRTGGPIDPTEDSEAWHALTDRAGVPRLRLHAARHTAASLLLASGVDLRRIRDILGHSQIGITADLYTHLAAESSRSDFERLASGLFAPADTPTRRRA